VTKGLELDRAKLVPIVCERLSTGKESLTKICIDLGFKRRTFNQWRKEDPEIDKQAALARQEWCEAIADDILDIADNTQEGVEIVERAGKKEVHTGDMLGHRKFRVDARLRLLKAYDPNRFGDKQKLEHSGAVTVNLNVTDSAL
jgi:hypothetical protein